MDYKHIESLLNKYWNCETSLEEEQQLREYFRNTDVPDQWKETANLFRYFDQHKKNVIRDESFDNNVLQTVRNTKPKGTTRLLYNTMRIAAGVAVLLMAVWFVRNEVRKSTPQEIVDTYDDPQLAFEETKKALMMISKSFGQAEEEAKKINLFNEAQQEIQKSPKEKTEKL
jgi:hypothetical protein